MTAVTVVHKYRLPFHENLDDKVKIPVRVGWLLHLGMQHGEIHIWAAVDPSQPEVPARFRLVGTGSPIDPDWHHLGTVMDGEYVWHVFAEPDELGLPITRRAER